MSDDLRKALVQILGWRELRSGANEFPIERIEDIARAALAAPTPEDRVSLLQDRIHEDTGAVRAGRTARVCIHGALRRQCETCDLADLVDELAEALRAVLNPWTITSEEFNKARALLARIDGGKPKVTA